MWEVTSVSLQHHDLQTVSINISIWLCVCSLFLYHLHLNLSLNREGHLYTTDDFTTSFLHFPLFSTALWDLAKSRPVYSLMLSSHLFFYLPCLFSLFTVARNMVMARPDEQETCPCHFSLHLFTMIRRSSCGLIACLHRLLHW